MKGVRARYHGTVDELKKAVEFMRQKYEFGMRAVIGLADEEICVKALYDFARTMGIPDDRISKIREALSMASTRDQLDMLRDFLYKELHPNGQTATNGGTHIGGKVFESKIVTEKELLLSIDEGWDILQTLSNGKFVVRRPNGA